MAIRLNSRAIPSHSAPIEQPILAFVDCEIAGGHEELAREQLVQRGLDYQTLYRVNRALEAHTADIHPGTGTISLQGVAPLFVGWLRERAALRLVCMVRNLGEFNNFMLDEIRPIVGIRETRTTLSFGGWAEVDTLLELEMEVSPPAVAAVEHTPATAASVWINVQPGMDRACFAALRNLPEHPDVRQVWLLHCHQTLENDLNLLLLGKSPAALSAYVTSWVRTAPGVINTEMGTVQDWRWLAEAEDLVELCGLFFQANHVAQATLAQTARVQKSLNNPAGNRESLVYTSPVWQY